MKPWFAKTVAVLCLGGAGFVGAKEVPTHDWAPALRQPPAHAVTNAPVLAPLLVTSKGRAITSRFRWERQRKVYLAAWLRALGGLPKHKAPLKTEILATEEQGDFLRQYVRYQVEKGVYTDGYLLTPRPVSGQLPAVVVFHPTTALQARGVAGLAPEYDAEKQQALQLVRRGYVVWCPRNYIFDGVETNGLTSLKLYAANAKEILRQHPQWTGMTRMVWDAIRAADFVSSLPQVDKKRIGCIGHSLGGKQAFYAAAFDERYRAAVSSEGGIGLNFSNWDDIWYLGAKVKSPEWTLQNHQVLSLVAPRPFLLLAGDSADNDRSWSYLEAVRPVYALSHASDNLGWFNHHQGHRYSPEARAVAEAFLDRHLGKEWKD